MFLELGDGRRAQRVSALRRPRSALGHGALLDTSPGPTQPPIPRGTSSELGPGSRRSTAYFTRAHSASYPTRDVGHGALLDSRPQRHHHRQGRLRQRLLDQSHGALVLPINASMYRRIGRYRSSKHRKLHASFNMMRHLLYSFPIAYGALYMQNDINV